MGAVINTLPDLFSAAVLKVNRSAQLDRQILGQVNGFILHPTYASGSNRFIRIFFYH